MTPNGNANVLTEWQVRVMISEALKEYDAGQDRRNKENSDQLKENNEEIRQIRETMNDGFSDIKAQFSKAAGIAAATKNYNQWIQWLPPTIFAGILAAIEIIKIVQGK